MIRDEKTGKFVGLTEEEKLQKQIIEAQSRLAEIKKEKIDAELAAKKAAEAKKSEERKVDVDKVQAAANLYLATLNKNNEKRAALKKEDIAAYEAYLAQLEAFKQKYRNYHLSITNDGKTVEVKVVEARETDYEKQIKEERERLKRLFNHFFNGLDF